jgi:hypothetical protein
VIRSTNAWGIALGQVFTTMGEMSGGDGTLLMTWLRLLGWIVVVEETDREWLAVGRHEDVAGRVFEVKASAGTHAQLAWKLFSRALAAIEQRRTPLAA